MFDNTLDKENVTWFHRTNTKIATRNLLAGIQTPTHNVEPVVGVTHLDYALSRLRTYHAQITPHNLSIVWQLELTVDWYWFLRLE